MATHLAYKPDRSRWRQAYSSPLSESCYFVGPPTEAALLVLAWDAREAQRFSAVALLAVVAPSVATAAAVVLGTAGPARVVAGGMVRTISKTMRREEFVHRARRSSFRRRCGSDGPGTAGPTAAHRHLQRRLSARILPGFPVRPYTRAVIAPFFLDHPSYLHSRSPNSHTSSRQPLFLRSLLVL